MACRMFVIDRTRGGTIEIPEETIVRIFGAHIFPFGANLES